MKITKDNLKEIHQKLQKNFSAKLLLEVDGYSEYLPSFKKNNPDAVTTNPYRFLNDIVEIEDYISHQSNVSSNGFLGFTLEQDYIRGESAYNENMGSEDMAVCNNMVFHEGDEIEFDQLGNILLIQYNSGLTTFIGTPFVFFVNPELLK